MGMTHEELAMRVVASAVDSSGRNPRWPEWGVPDWQPEAVRPDSCCPRVGHEPCAALLCC